MNQLDWAALYYSRSFGHVAPVAGLATMSGCHTGWDGAGDVSVALMTLCRHDHGIAMARRVQPLRDQNGR